MEEIERDVGDLVENTGNEILKVWNAIPESYSIRKIVILSIFSSTYSCESLYLELNFMKSDLRNRLTDKCSDACTWLKDTNYKKKNYIK